MVMTLKNSEIYNYANALAGEFAQQEVKLPLKVNFYLQKNLKELVALAQDIEQQRVAIARALVSEAPIILADEPTGNLDSVTAGEIIEILKTLAKERNKCVIVVTHSKEVADAADIILELNDKKLKEVSKIGWEVY